VSLLSGEPLLSVLDILVRVFHASQSPFPLRFLFWRASESRLRPLLQPHLLYDHFLPLSIIFPPPRDARFSGRPSPNLCIMTGFSPFLLYSYPDSHPPPFRRQASPPKEEARFPSVLLRQILQCIFDAHPSENPLSGRLFFFPPQNLISVEVIVHFRAPFLPRPRPSSGLVAPPPLFVPNCFQFPSFFSLRLVPGTGFLERNLCGYHFSPFFSEHSDSGLRGFELLEGSPDPPPTKRGGSLFKDDFSSGSMPWTGQLP